MKPLKHDLSANETKVNFDLLVQTAHIATSYAKVACERHLGEVQNTAFKGNFCGLANAAQSLSNAAQDLAIAANTLYVLTESKDRATFTVIGKPAVTEYKGQ